MKFYLLIIISLLLVMPIHAFEISNVVIDGVTEHAARFYFETDVAASTKVSWMSDGINRSQTNNQLTKIRQWYISGLTPDTDYIICLQAFIGDELSECSYHSFRTLAEAQDISLPEPPRAYVDVSMPAMTGKILNVSKENCNDPTNGLQALIDIADGGDTIVIPQNLVCTGTYILRSRPESETEYIVIQTENIASKIPAGKRVVPDDTASMATLRSNGFGALRSGPNSWCPNGGSFMMNPLEAQPDSMLVMYRCLNSSAKEYELIPYQNGSSLPATCAAGEWFYNSTNGKMNGKNVKVNYAYQCINDNEYVMMQPEQKLHLHEVIDAEEGAHHYRLIGLELTRVPPAANEPHPSLLADNGARQLGVLHGNLVALNANTHHIILDRVYIHGNGFPERIRVGLGLGADYAALIDSRIDRIQIWKSNGFIGGEEAAVGIQLGSPGPALIHNNYIDTPGITIFADSGVDPPHDVVISNNHITASLNYFDGSSQADEYFHFNRHRFELKRGERFILRNNLIENSWSVVNQGALLILSPRPPFGGSSALYNYTTGVRDILFESNVLRNAPALIAITGGNGLTTATPNPITTQRIKFDNNLIYNITGKVWQSPKQYLGGTGSSGLVFSVVGGVQDLIITHNTIFNNTGDYARLFHYEGGNTRNSDLMLNDNLLVNPSTLTFMQGNGVFGTAVGTNVNYLNNVWVEDEKPAWQVKGNAVMWGINNKLNLADSLPNNVWLDNLAIVGFRNAYNNDFALTTSSPIRGVASDGNNPGVDWSIIESVLEQSAMVVPTPTGPTPTPQLPNDLNNDGQETIADLIVLVNKISQKESADLNNDGKTNIFDVMLLARQLRDAGKL